jgi:O-antigen ligase
VRSPVLLAPLTDLSAGVRLSRSRLDSVILYGMVSVLLFGPLALGAVEAWSTFVLEAGAALLFLLWVIWQAKTGELRVLGSPLFLPMAIFAALIAVQLASGRTSYFSVTRSEALLYCAYGLLCFLMVQSLCRTSQLKALAWLLSGYGFAVAAFALVQSFSSNGKLYWIRTPRFGGWIYGPYVNHNHYAGLMEMLVPIPLVAALFHYTDGPRKALAATAAAVMASTIFLSGSRGGMAAFAVEMAILCTLLIRRRKGRKVAVVLGFFLVLVTGLAAWLGGGALSKRLASIDTEARTEVSGGMRLDIDHDSLKMFAYKPLMGWGLGVFPTVYPKYRTFYTNVFVNEAHNDYLQLLVEMGALGFAVMLWFIVVVYYRGAKKLSNWTKDPNGAITWAAMLGISGIMVHSLVDFNLQIPSNAALFYVLCMVAAMEPRFSAFSRVRHRHPRPEAEGQLSA